MAFNLFMKYYLSSFAPSIILLLIVKHLISFGIVLKNKTGGKAHDPIYK